MNNNPSPIVWKQGFLGAARRPAFETQVSRVEPYWLKWMAKWPSAAALAEADEEDVKALWSGLGIVAIVLIGMVLYQQTPSAGQLMGMALITAGVVLVNLSPATSNG